jgi:hypothetical protein
VRADRAATLGDNTSDPSLLILGADTVVAAQPATPVQLAHACLADGFDQVIPGSWGDELVAEHILGRLPGAELPAVQCSCPRVLQRLSARADDIASMTIRAIAPPIAVARYLRAVFAPSPVTLTYVGACPAGADPAFEMWMTPEELFMRLDRRGIDLSAQPTAFDGVLSPDRRRFWSEPGGIPHAAVLERHGVEVHALASEDVVTDVADLLLSRRRILIDIALSARCACSGAAALEAPESARVRVVELEPPRSLSPVLHVVASHDLALAETYAESSPRSVQGIVSLAASDVERVPVDSTSPQPATAAAVAPSPRRTPTGVSRALLGAMPQTRREGGRQLPRAYIARRRSSPRGLRAERGSQRAEPDQAESRRRRALVAGVGALGLGIGFALAWLARLLY